MPEGLELSVWGRPACVSRFSLLNNSACLFTCSLLTLKLQPPVTLLLNTLMIMTSALPLALPSCVKYWESFVNVCVSVSCCVCKTERVTEIINTARLWVCVCVFCCHHVQCHYERCYLKKMDVTECVALWLGYRDMTVCLSSEPVYCCFCIMILYRRIFSYCFQKLWSVHYVLPRCLTCTHRVSLRLSCS